MMGSFQSWFLIHLCYYISYIGVKNVFLYICIEKKQSKPAKFATLLLIALQQRSQLKCRICISLLVGLYQQNNRPYHGFRRHLDGQAKRSEITVLLSDCVWESDGKCLFPGLNFSQSVNQTVKILGRSLHSPIASLKDVAVLEVAELFFSNLPYICLYIFSLEPRIDIVLPCQIYREMYGK